MKDYQRLLQVAGSQRNAALEAVRDAQRALYQAEKTLTLIEANSNTLENIACQMLAEEEAEKGKASDTSTLANIAHRRSEGK